MKKLKPVERFNGKKVNREKGQLDENKTKIKLCFSYYLALRGNMHKLRTTSLSKSV